MASAFNRIAAVPAQLGIPLAQGRAVGANHGNHTVLHTMPSTSSRKLMLERKIEEQASIDRVVAKNKGHTCTDDQLRVIGKVDGVPDARQNGEFEIALQSTHAVDALDPIRNGFKQNVGVTRYCVNATAAQSVNRWLMAGDIEKGPQTEIGVQGDAVGDNLAYRQQKLVAEFFFFDTFYRFAGRQDEADARGDGRAQVGLGLKLIAIVQGDFAEPLDFAEVVRDRVGQLVRLTDYGPFLRVAELPLPPLAAQIGDVLNNAWFLIVGFLDKERVVLNAFGRNLVVVLRQRRLKAQDRAT